MFFVVLEVANGDYGNCTEVLAKTVDRGKWRSAMREIKSKQKQYLFIFI